MKIIITGASGFVGQNLIKYFHKKNEIIKISLRNSFFNLDNDVNAIIHLAGKAHDTKNISDENEYFKVNRDLTVKVFDEFLKSDINDFFFFSSVKSIADSVNDVLYEDSQASPETPYGKSKLAAEEYLLSQNLPQGKRLFIIRPTMIHGEGNKGNLNLLYKVVSKGIPWPLASFENKRSFISIDNLCFLIDNMLRNKKVPSGAYNFSDDEVVSTNKLIQIIANCSGKKAQLLKIPIPFIKLIAKIGDIGLPLNTERLNKLTDNYIVSNSKIKKALGINRLPLTVEEGLVKTINSFRH